MKRVYFLGLGILVRRDKRFMFSFLGKIFKILYFIVKMWVELIV